MKKTCTKCGEEKELELFVKNKNCKNNRENICKSCSQKYKRKHYNKNRERYRERKRIWQKKNQKKINEYLKKWKENNKEKLKIYRKNYYNKNKKKEHEYHRKYANKRKKQDSLFRLTCLIRTIISQQIKKNGYSKKSKTNKILGCSYKEFKQYLESQFQEGMTWDNYGIDGWHIDHIYPVSKARDEQHLLELNHYTNLQPLWAKDNIAKGNRLDWSE